MKKISELKLNSLSKRDLTKKNWNGCREVIIALTAQLIIMQIQVLAYVLVPQELLPHS